MKNIYLNIFKFNKNILFKTLKYLKKSNIVGLPTETVYGLAGSAYSKKAVEKIYSLKKRPKINPLIIHYYNLNKLSDDVEINKTFLKLYKKLCPGPITFVMKKKKSSKICSIATAKLDTVAVRFPSNKKTRIILSKLNFPLAMPSANKSTGISPVRALDVAEEFKNKIKIIIDDGNSKIGIESTVVDLTEKIRILRPGIISNKKISKILGKKIKIAKKHHKIKSPGALKKHYSPNIPMKLNQIKAKKNHAFITFGKNYDKAQNTFNLSRKSNLDEAAKNLYKIFRKIKKLNYKKIYVAKIPNKGAGVAINDRLKHAAN
tara:strand:+ start:3693 stop:4646 length:954 start_codon:yes stop_codon:yes gene_type:complete